MKKNKPLEILLIILAISLLGYLVYVKEFKKEKVNDYEKNDPIINNETSIIKWKDLEDFPKNDNIKFINLSYDEIRCEEDDIKYCSKIELLKNNNLSFKLNDIDILFKCSKYEDDKCNENEITLDNKIKFSFGINDEYEDTNTLIYKTDNYYIIKQENTIFGQGKLIIYSLTGEVLKEINNSVTEIDVVSEEENESYEYIPTIKDNKLYIVMSDYLNYENGLDNIVHFGYIDLSKSFEFVELYQIKAIVSLGI